MSLDGDSLPISRILAVAWFWCAECVFWKQGLRVLPATGTVGNKAVLAWKLGQAGGLVNGVSEDLGFLLSP